MQGELSELNWCEIFSLATAGKKTGRLLLCQGAETVEVFFSDGVIVHATSPIGDGEQALYYPITWDEGSFTLQADWTAPARTVGKGVGPILDAVRCLRKEWESARELISSPQCVFQLSDLAEEGAGSITIPHAAWQVLCKVDGRRTVQEIAVALEAPYVQTAKLLTDLCKAGLVALMGSAAEKIVSTELLTMLVGGLTDVMGPIAPFVVRDQIRALGESQDKFPQAKLENLIGLVSREITDGKLRNEFEAAIAKIRFRRLLQETLEIGKSKDPSRQKCGQPSVFGLPY
jgi:hypothetical protein